MPTLASARTRSRLRGGLAIYLFVVAAIGALGLLVGAISATVTGNDPQLGAHPVRTTATVADYDVVSCTRGGCRYDEKVTFLTAAGAQQTATISDVDTRPIIGGTLTVYYPAGSPSAVQTDGPHGPVYYWLGTLGFGTAAALLLLFLVRRRRRTG